MNNINYNKEFHKVVDSIGDGRPSLLLHACCAPCASSCMERVRDAFSLTVFFYNPNITNAEEYRKRADELKRLIDAYNELPGGHINLLEDEYEPRQFTEVARGYEDCSERGERCLRCFDLRLSRTGEVAKARGFDYFTTTLTLSPLKDATALNTIGYRVAENIKSELQGDWSECKKAEGKQTGPLWLPSDFKKENGYKRSIELSNQYGLYRQNYCGCVYSRRDSELA